MKKLFLLFAIICLYSCTLNNKLKYNYQISKRIYDNDKELSVWLKQYEGGKITCDEFVSLIKDKEIIDKMQLTCDSLYYKNHFK